MINVNTVINSNSTKDYFRTLIQLMQCQSGTHNIASVVEHSTGEILVWKHKDAYQRDFAIISLTEKGQLTPKSEKILKKLIEYAYGNKVIKLEYSGENYCLVPYSGEVDNVVVTMGYVLKKIDAIIIIL